MSISCDNTVLNREIAKIWKRAVQQSLMQQEAEQTDNTTGYKQQISQLIWTTLCGGKMSVSSAEI